MITIQKDDVVRYAVLFVLAFVIVGYQYGIFTKIPLPIPTPTPATHIVVKSQEEYDVIISALDFVANEWALSRYSSLDEARQGLDALMGGRTDGVEQAVQDKILAEFTDDCDFMETIEKVKEKLKIK